MKPITRRQHLRTLGLAALASSLLTVGKSHSGEPEDIGAWLDRLYENARALRKGSISGLQWQETMDVIYGDTNIASLHKRLDFPRLAAEIVEKMPETRGELFHRVELPGSAANNQDGKEPHRALITKVAHIKKGRSVPPHGHSNMASAFLCISGEFHVRQFDKIEDQADHLVVRKTVDAPSAGAGTWSSISDYRNNVHWLTAKSEDCFLFTSKLIGIERGRPLNGRINVDLHRAKALGSDTSLAEKITSQEAAELY